MLNGLEVTCDRAPDYFAERFMDLYEACSWLDRPAWMEWRVTEMHKLREALHD